MTDTTDIRGPNGEPLIEPGQPVLGPGGERCWYAADNAPQALAAKPCWGWITLGTDGIPYCNGHRHPAQIAAGWEYAPRTIHATLRLDLSRVTLKGG